MRRRKCALAYISDHPGQKSTPPPQERIQRGGSRGVLRGGQVIRTKDGVEPLVVDGGWSLDVVEGGLDELEAAPRPPPPPAWSSPVVAAARRGRGGGDAASAAVEADEPAPVGDRLELRVVVDGMQLAEHAASTRPGRLHNQPASRPAGVINQLSVI